MERFYTATIHDEVWTGREDANAFEYIFQNVECIDLRTLSNKSPAFGLIGFESDEGIRRNKGNIGAALGPQAFRNVFAKLATPKPISILDLGNIGQIENQLEEAQEELGSAVYRMLQNHLFPIVIGGGHETAWGHYQGLKKYYPKDEIAILNFDAHFDLRPLLSKNRGSSGTPFRQIQEYLQDQQQTFHYYCAGIQPYANCRTLFEYAHQHQVKYILAEQIHKAPYDLQFIEKLIHQHDKIYVTVCMDVFSAAIAPGVSSPQSLGIDATYVLNALKKLKQSQKVIGLDIVELSPPYDIQNHTAKLAACLIMSFLLS